MKILPATLGLLMVVMSSNGLSQGLKLGPMGGAAWVQKSDAQNYTGNISRGGLGLGESYLVGVKAVLPLPGSRMSLAGRVSYLSVHGTGSLPGNGIYIGGPGDVETTLRVWSFGMGAEFTLLRGPVAPYVGANIQLNSFRQLRYVLKDSTGTSTYLSGGGIRVGMGLELGIAVSLSTSILLDLGGTYHIMAPLADFAPADFNTLGFSIALLFKVL